MSAASEGWYAYAVIRPGSGPVLGEAISFVGAHLGSYRAFRVDDWPSAAAIIYAGQLVRRASEDGYRAAFDVMLWLEAHLFGRHAVLLVSDGVGSQENAVCSMQAAKAEWRRAVSWSLNGAFRIFVDLDRVLGSPGAWPKAGVKGAISVSDAQGQAQAFASVHPLPQGRWDDYWLQYVHVPDIIDAPSDWQRLCAAGLVRSSSELSRDALEWMVGVDSMAPPPGPAGWLRIRPYAGSPPSPSGVPPAEPELDPS